MVGKLFCTFSTKNILYCFYSPWISNIHTTLFQSGGEIPDVRLYIYNFITKKLTLIPSVVKARLVPPARGWFDSNPHSLDWICFRSHYITEVSWVNEKSLLTSWLPRNQGKLVFSLTNLAGSNIQTSQVKHFTKLLLNFSMEWVSTENFLHLKIVLCSVSSEKWKQRWSCTCSKHAEQFLQHNEISGILKCTR